MATFRQEQIDEILNYERSLNRRIYDTEILAVSRMNDERTPPSNRDIKFEALLGGLVDKLKQTIAEAVQSVASKQYPSLNAVNSAKILALNTGVKGVRAPPPNSEQAEQNKLAAESIQKALADARRGKQLDKANVGTVSVPLDPDGVPNVDDEPLDEIDAMQQLLYNRRKLQETSGEDLFMDDGLGRGRPMKARHQGFGADFVKRRKVGGVEPEEKGETTGQSETAKSEKSMTKTTENILYDCIGQYNGIIDKLLEATQQNGLYKNKRLASASNVQYYSNVLKGLLEPFKHLMFELAQVQQPETASLFNMVGKVVEIIDICPPFQKIDVSAYRNGKPDFQGFNDDLVLNDYDGYLEKLMATRKNYMNTIRQFDNSVLVNKATFSKVDDKYKSELFKEIAEKQEIAKGILEKLQAEIIKIKSKRNSPLFNIDDDVDETLLDMVESGEEMLRATTGMASDKGGLVRLSEVPLTREEVAKLKLDDKDKQLVKASAFSKLIDEQQANIKKLLQKVQKQGGLQDDETGAQMRAYQEASSKLRLQLVNYERINGLSNERSKRAEADAKKIAEMNAVVAKLKKGPEGEGEGEEAEKGDARGSLEVAKGEGPKANEGAPPPDADADADVTETEPESALGISDKYETVAEQDAQDKEEVEQILKTYKAKLDKMTVKELQEEVTEVNKYIDATENKLNISAPKTGYKKQGELIKMLMDHTEQEEIKARTYVEPKKKGDKSGKGYPRAHYRNHYETDSEDEDSEEEEEEEEESEEEESEEEEQQGKGKPLADYLANPRQQYNRMGRPVSNDDKINNEMIKLNKNFQKHNPIHETPVGSLYPFYEKADDAVYDFPTKLRYERNIRQPPQDARGADYSLLQGEIGGPTVNKEVKRQFKSSQRQVVTPAQALQNVLKGAGKKSGALKKLVFDDEGNDMYGEGEGYGNQGFIPEDKDDHFKFPDLKKQKEKAAAAKLSGRKR